MWGSCHEDLEEQFPQQFVLVLGNASDTLAAHVVFAQQSENVEYLAVGIERGGLFVFVDGPPIVCS